MLETEFWKTMEDDPAKRWQIVQECLSTLQDYYEQVGIENQEVSELSISYKKMK